MIFLLPRPPALQAAPGNAFRCEALLKITACAFSFQTAACHIPVPMTLPAAVGSVPGLIGQSSVETLDKVTGLNRRCRDKCRGRGEHTAQGLARVQEVQLLQDLFPEVLVVDGDLLHRDVLSRGDVEHLADPATPHCLGHQPPPRVTADFR